MAFKKVGIGGLLVLSTWLVACASGTDDDQTPGNLDTDGSGGDMSAGYAGGAGAPYAPPPPLGAGGAAAPWPPPPPLGAGGTTPWQPPPPPPPGAGGDPGGFLPPPPGAGGDPGIIAPPPPFGAGGDPGVVPPPPPPPPGGGMIRGPDPTSATASNKGPYAVQTYVQGLRDGPGYGTQTMHYPTDATAPFAAVTIVPGFVSPESSIQPWGPFLASHGIVTLTIGTNTGGDLPPVRAEALMDALKTVEAENTRAGSPLSGKIDTSRFAIMGWSMGGGGTLLAANTHPNLKAAISLCGWNPGGRYATDTVPSLMFAATADPLAGGQSQGFYASIPANTPKMLFEVAGGDHFIANNPASVNKQIGLYGLSWMKVFLEGDERYRQFLKQKPAGTQTFTSNVQ